MNTNQQDVIEMESLVGKHILSGVDEINRQIGRAYSSELCQCINFVLDGITYTAIEDPDDGWRSMLDEIIKSDDTVKNKFQGVEVIITHIDTIEKKALLFYDTKNGKLVMEIGTEYYDSYYPSFIANWSPENLSINEPRVNR